jgi:hypothetical protein
MPPFNCSGIDNERNAWLFGIINKDSVAEAIRFFSDGFSSSMSRKSTYTGTEAELSILPSNLDE